MFFKIFVKGCECKFTVGFYPEVHFQINCDVTYKAKSQIKDVQSLYFKIVNKFQKFISGVEICNF